MKKTIAYLLFCTVAATTGIAGAAGLPEPSTDYKVSGSMTQLMKLDEYSDWQKETGTITYYRSGRLGKLEKVRHTGSGDYASTVISVGSEHHFTINKRGCSKEIATPVMANTRRHEYSRKGTETVNGVKATLYEFNPSSEGEYRLRYWLDGDNVPVKAVELVENEVGMVREITVNFTERKKGALPSGTFAYGDSCPAFENAKNAPSSGSASRSASQQSSSRERKKEKPSAAGSLVDDLTGKAKDKLLGGFGF